ncbi:DnaJ domain-containing protein, partial [Kockovaella imperatae]
SWTKEDYEIFDIVSELEAAEGKGTTFYSWLEIEPSASKNDIVKAYRKKSLELHPDKNVGGKDIEARFARLGLINEILRSPERRDRYNFFYKNGVPKWRGTGYYYSRYRPTLSHTLIFLVFLTSLFQLLVLRMNYSRDKKRVDYFYTTALALNKNGAGKREKFYDPNSTAGPEEQDVPEVVGRRVKVPMVQGHDMAGVLDLAVVNDQVYVVS